MRAQRIMMTVWALAMTIAVISAAVWGIRQASSLDWGGRRGHRRVQLLSLPHRWGGHSTEFFPIGTAVRPLRPDHVIDRPQLVLPLSDR